LRLMNEISNIIEREREREREREKERKKGAIKKQTTHNDMDL